jgi:hypothetical protein
MTVHLPLNDYNLLLSTFYLPFPTLLLIPPLFCFNYRVIIVLISRVLPNRTLKRYEQVDYEHRRLNPSSPPFKRGRNPPSLAKRGGFLPFVGGDSVFDIFTPLLHKDTIESTVCSHKKVVSKFLGYLLKATLGLIQRMTLIS